MCLVVLSHGVSGCLPPGEKFSEKVFLELFDNQRAHQERRFSAHNELAGDLEFAVGTDPILETYIELDFSPA